MKMNKQTVLALALGLSMVAALPSCEKDKVEEPTSTTSKVDDTELNLTLSTDKESVKVGESKVVSAKTYNGTITAESADKTIATAEVDGANISITGVKVGTTTINVSDSKGKKATISVEVTKATAPAKKDVETITVKKGADDFPANTKEEVKQGEKLELTIEKGKWNGAKGTKPGFDGTVTMNPADKVAATVKVDEGTQIATLSFQVKDDAAEGDVDVTITDAKGKTFAFKITVKAKNPATPGVVENITVVDEKGTPIKSTTEAALKKGNGIKKTLTIEKDKWNGAKGTSPDFAGTVTTKPADKVKAVVTVAANGTATIELTVMDGAVQGDVVDVTITDKMDKSLTFKVKVVDPAEVQKAEQALEAAKAEVAKLEGEVAKATTAKTDADKKVTDKEAEIAKLANELAKKPQVITDYEKEQKLIDDLVSDFEKKVQAIKDKAAVSGLADAKKTKLENIVKAAEPVAQAMKAGNDVATLVEALRKAITDNAFGEDDAELKALVEALNKKIALPADVVSKKTELKKKEAEYKAANDKKSKTEAAKKTAEAELVTLKKDAETAQTTLEAKQKAKADADAAVTEAQEKVDKLNQGEKVA